MSVWPDALASPWLAIALGVVACAVAWLRSLERQLPAIPWPSAASESFASDSFAAGSSGGAATASRLVAIGLRLAVLGLLAVAIASPMRVDKAPPEPGHGLDIVVVVDTSASMAALDTSVLGENRSRLDLARSAIEHFARERVAVGDRVGLVAFGESAFTQSPLSSDGALLSTAVQQLRIGMAGDTTALGDALALAIKRVTAGRAWDGAGAGPTGPAGLSLGHAEAPGGVVVALTDGRSNAGRIPLANATELARSLGVRVHTVAIGSERGPVAVAADGEGGQAGGIALRVETHAPDPETLRRVAERSGGSFFTATHAAELDRVYAAIDAIERPLRTLPARIVERPTPEPWLAGAGALLLCEISWLRVLRRRLP